MNPQGMDRYGTGPDKFCAGECLLRAGAEDRAPRSARTLVADGRAPLRSGIRGVLGSLPDLEAVGEAADGTGAVALCRVVLP